MGSSYYPISGYQVSFPATGPTGSTGDQGNTGFIGYGPTGNTGISIISMGLCGEKLRTNFDDGTTYETEEILKGYTGETLFFAGISVGNGLSVYSGLSYDTNTLNFRTIRGRTSSSGRAKITVGLVNQNSLLIEYTNSSSEYALAISGTDTIRTFVGYSGNTLVSLQKTSYDNYSSFVGKNIIEKSRGLGFSGATSSDFSLCNYITGGTFFYTDQTGASAATACKVVNINPYCISSNSVDLNVKNSVYVADMKQNTTIVILGNSGGSDAASAISLVLMNAKNGPTASSIGQKRFQLSSTGGRLLWPFNLEPCFCGPTGTNVYHFYNLGGYTWYGSVVAMTDSSLFDKCSNNIIQGLSVAYGACCINDGTVGGTCSFESLGDCMKRGASAFWHAGLTCGSNPCEKTGGCCLSFIDKATAYSSLCINGITCINCISGMVYDAFGKTYNASSFTYLGNGVTCTSANCDLGA